MALLTIMLLPAHNYSRLLGYRNTPPVARSSASSVWHARHTVLSKAVQCSPYNTACFALTLIYSQGFFLRQFPLSNTGLLLSMTIGASACSHVKGQRLISCWQRIRPLNTPVSNIPHKQRAPEACLAHLQGAQVHLLQST